MVRVDLDAKVDTLQQETKFLQVFYAAVSLGSKLPGSPRDGWKTEKEREVSLGCP